ncbi:beta-ketoacyl-ACP synthase II [Meiothermus granaticius]|uniref:3-oxoacyl-[acyl-carrier-protein] synthase 2 n=1 Tax=Meiothermus granaticius NBRC 107808 TaxID=1227551 RepID=A0A399FBV8_9DEIN|nr:beta-ketoacyl-ACP synthase II [Meiothermus granaticius]RIH93650.1 3-oxoacyl-[acyl-carrier-protein] synthase 2 [Meiothermus granaticius NBRC 107808]GEM86812.1 3-oxoacyl-[acyl-carrier-protein] synthase 2 [Meiothermus granaticius NBRC 107808]
MRRVVITGLGPVAPNAVGAEAFHQAQLEGRSGIGRITRFDPSPLRCQIAGEVQIAPEEYLDKKEMRRLDRFVQLALIASELALKDSGLELEREDLTRIGTLVGSGIGGMETWETQSRVFIERGPERLSPFFIPMIIANMASGQLAMRYGFMGPSSTSVTACTTGADAIGNAFRVIQLGEAEVMVTGGSEAVVTAMAMGGFDVMRALSTRNDAPTQASRPFSASRDGFVLSEGAAIVVLEDYEHAKARGAKIYAELVGFGRSADAYHITDPHPEGTGAALSMQRAMQDAKINPEQVGYVNAHGTSTPVGDRAETLAIKKVFGPHAYKLAVSSTKSMIGHLLGAAGAIEAIASVQALVSGILPPTINLTDPDPELDLDYVPNTPREQPVQYVLSNSFAFGGMNATLAFKRI